MSTTLFVFTLATALGCGLVAGAFYAFSSFVMKALGDVPAPTGIAAMQSINVQAPTPFFMAGFVGTAVLSVGLGGWALLHLDDPGAGWLVAGCALYLVGSFGLTMAANVPRNDKLMTFEATSAEGARYWATYLVEWTRLNHVRMLASLAACGCLVAAVRVAG